MWMGDTSQTNSREECPTNVQRVVAWVAIRDGGDSYSLRL